MVLSLFIESVFRAHFVSAFNDSRASLRGLFHSCIMTLNEHEISLTIRIRSRWRPTEPAAHPLIPSHLLGLLQGSALWPHFVALTTFGASSGMKIYVILDMAN